MVDELLSCESIKRHRSDVEAVEEGDECGIILMGVGDIKEGDILQCVVLEDRS